MRAIYYDHYGPADVLQLGERPMPEPGPEQVLVKVAAAGVNPIDRRLRSGQLQDFFQQTFPIIPGWDVAGRIAAVGSDVTQWKVGDDIVGLGFTWKLGVGSYAEYMTIDETAIARKPERLSFTEGAALPLVSLTAWQALTESASVGPGQIVFIQAGAGGIGSVALTMARHLGATTVTTTRARNFDYVGARGADHPIDYRTSNYVHELKKIAPDGVDFVLEALEDKIFIENAIRITKRGGTVIYMNNEPPEMPDLSAKGIHAEWLHHRADGKMLAEIMALYDSGALVMPEIEVMPFEQAVAAHQKSESGTTRGKLVLKVQDI